MRVVSYTGYFVYIICHEQDLPPIKVGFTNDLKKRLSQIKNGNPYKIYYYSAYRVCYEDEARKIESAFHKKMKEKRLCGEWFDMGAADAESILIQVGKEVLNDPKYLLSDKLKKRSISSNEEKCVNFISEYVKNNGVIPSVDIISKETKILRSKVFRYIKSLNARGYFFISKDEDDAPIAIEIASVE